VEETMNLIAILLAAAAAQEPLSPIGSVNSPLNDYNLSFDSAERVLVFARSEADFRNAQIYIAERNGRGWSEPRPIEFSDARYADSDPWLTPDGRTLFFISDRPSAGREEGRSDYDIWRSTRTNKGWSTPEHLGPQVNGRGQELGPELHDGVLYFSSARRSGVGGLDIYRAVANGLGFGPATLLQGPFNTASSESDFTLSKDGLAAMFWRSVGEVGTIHISYRGPAGWSAPTPLPSRLNPGPFNFTPSFSSDGRKVRFASTRERSGQTKGLADLYEAQLTLP
jgi:hypothetical protein